MLEADCKLDVGDLRDSPALDIIALSEQKGALVDYHDPYIPTISPDRRHKKSQPDYLHAANQFDCAVIVTNRTCYDDASTIQASRLIVDTRNAIGTFVSNYQKIVRI